MEIVQKYPAKVYFRLSALTLAMIASISAIAQTDVAELEDIVVTASGSAQYLKNAPASVTVINQKN